ncbi:MAG: hypothetical protein HY226_04675 [Candidatus Vogelbacteria bacterium]|nr:hypothetical protein [Candidatus Vogelbacteria bacterium]
MGMKKWLEKAEQSEREYDDQEQKEIASNPEIAEFANIFRNFEKSLIGKTAKTLLLAKDKHVEIYHKRYREVPNSCRLYFSWRGFEEEYWGRTGADYMHISSVELVKEILQSLATYHGGDFILDKEGNKERFTEICLGILKSLTSELDRLASY